MLPLHHLDQGIDLCTFQMPEVFLLCAPKVAPWRSHRCGDVQDRFLTEFGDQDAMEGEAGAEGAARQAKGGNTEPAEHQALFAGNTDDHFRLGIKITR